MKQFHPGLEDTREPNENELQECLNLINNSLRQKTYENRSKIVPRVGRDVYASCGTFITDEI